MRASKTLLDSQPTKNLAVPRQVAHCSFAFAIAIAIACALKGNPKSMLRYGTLLPRPQQAQTSQQAVSCAVLAAFRVAFYGPHGQLII